MAAPAPQSAFGHAGATRARSQQPLLHLELEVQGSSRLPGVYAAADTATAAKRGIRGALAAHFDALRTLGREPQLKADVTVLRRDVYATRRDSLRFVGVGALLGRGTSRAKAAASRRNGRG